MDTAHDIIERAKEQLSFMKFCLDDLENKSIPPARRRLSFSNILTLGRSITFILQNLRSSEIGEDAFNAWYLPVQEVMKDDDLLNFFKNARNVFEKRGILNANQRYAVGYPTDLIPYLGEPPENAVTCFVGDNFVGAGWVTMNENGEWGRVFVDIDKELDIELHFEKAPATHLGQPIPRPVLEVCCHLYYDFMVALVSRAQEELRIT